jgi:hypothetical protein
MEQQTNNRNQLTKNSLRTACSQTDFLWWKIKVDFVSSVANSSIKILMEYN